MQQIKLFLNEEFFLFINKNDLILFKILREQIKINQNNFYYTCLLLFRNIHQK